LQYGAARKSRPFSCAFSDKVGAVQVVERVSAELEPYEHSEAVPSPETCEGSSDALFQPIFLM